MSFVPPTFSSFGKSNLFQDYSKDSLDHTVKLINKSSSKEAVAFESGAVYAPKAQPRGYIKSAFNVNGYVVDSTVHTDASKANSVALRKKNVLAKSMPGLNVGVTLTTSEKDFSNKPKYGAFETVNLDYARPNLAVTAAVTSDVDSLHSVSASAAVGFEGFSVGGDVKLVKAGESALQAKSYNAGVAYAHTLKDGKQLSGALLSDAKFEKIKAVLLANKLLSDKSLSAGVQVKVDLQAPKVGAPQREVIVGGKLQCSPSTSYTGAAVLTNGNLVFGVEHKLRNPNLVLGATAAFALPNTPFAPYPVSKFGVSLTLGDY